MQHSSAHFRGASGGQIYYHYWHPGSAVKALILIAHGAAEHGGRYERFAAHFTQRGFAVAAIDLEGHGRSTGKRCCLRSFDDYTADITALEERLRSDHADVPFVLLGHSMGGLVACKLLLERQQRYVACVLSGAAIMTVQKPPVYQQRLLQLLSAVLPNLGLLQLDASGVSRNAEEVARYVADPLNYGGKLSVRLLAEIFRVAEIVQSRAAEIQLPMMILHGGADVMTDPAGSEFMYEAVGSADKVLHIVPGAFHEIFNEPEREQIFGEIEAWLSQRLSMCERIA